VRPVEGSSTGKGLVDDEGPLTLHTLVVFSYAILRANRSSSGERESIKNIV